jgi:hypothetical protein
MLEYHTMEMYREHNSEDPYILRLWYYIELSGHLHAPTAFTYGKGKLGAHWKDSWVNFSYTLGIVVQKEIPGILSGNQILSVYSTARHITEILRGFYKSLLGKSKFLLMLLMYRCLKSGTNGNFIYYLHYMLYMFIPTLYAFSQLLYHVCADFAKH